MFRSKQKTNSVARQLASTAFKSNRTDILQQMQGKADKLRFEFKYETFYTQYNLSCDI